MVYIQRRKKDVFDKVIERAIRGQGRRMTKKKHWICNECGKKFVIPNFRRWEEEGGLSVRPMVACPECGSFDIRKGEVGEE